jgi:hypothetical protein
MNPGCPLEIKKYNLQHMRPKPYLVWRLQHFGKFCRALTVRKPTVRLKDCKIPLPVTQNG